MYDGDYTTYAWTAANQAVGDTMTYTLNQTIGIDDVTFVFSGSDCLSDGAVIEISADGSQWTTIGEVDRSYLESHNYRYTCDGEGQEAQYVRLRITSINANAWLRIYEVEVNKTTNEQLAQPIAYLADNTYVGEVADRSVSTSYQMATDDVLTYQLIDNLKADEINVLYTSDNAGEEATIEVLGDDGWMSLGTLDGETFTFDVSTVRNAQAVRISANGNALNVFEIYETGDTYVEAKRADLQSAINTVPEKDESAYTEDSWAAYEEALAHAEELMAGVELSQAEADAAAQAIRDAINNLVENGEQPATDKDALNEAIAAAEALDGEDYTTNSWNVLTSALETAKTVAADDNAAQTEIDDAANALNGAKAALQVKASEAAIDALQNVVDKANALQEDSLAELIAAAQALLDDPANASVTAVVSAMLDLSEAMADLNTDESSDKLREDLLATIDYIEENILPNLDNVRPGKVQELETAIAQAYQVYNNANATDDEIRTAIRTLSEKAQELWEIVSKAELNALIEAAEAIEADGYTAESYEALQAAIAAAKGTAADDNATTSDVTRAITNLSTAIANLEKITLDTSALEHEIELAEQILANIDDYVASTVEGLQEKADAAKAALDDAASQAEIDEATKTLREARLSARTKADKSALRELIAYANSLDLSAYSDINGLRRALVDAGNVMNKEEATQDEVNAAVEALQAELDALTPKAESSTNADTTNTAAVAQTGLFAGVLAAAAGALLAVRRRKNQE
ncbi:MAG: discoidin domain-containing protein [Merdibacter sp.]